MRIGPALLALLCVGASSACESSLVARCGGAESTGGAEAQARAGREAPASRHDGHDPSQHRPSRGMQHDFSDVPRFVEAFDAPERAAWQRPAEVVRILAVEPGQTVVDLGTGTGYFLPFLSVAVGARGRVLALDSEPAMIDYVRRRADREGLANVEARTTRPDDPGLDPASVDRILVVDTWHHLPDRPRYAARLRDALRPDGQILVVDFTMESPQGPSVEHRVAPERVVEELASAGFAAEIVRHETLPDQYIVRGTRR